MRPLRQLSCLVALSLAIVTAAPAAEAAEPAASSAEESVWYGLPSLGLDATAYGLLLASLDVGGRASDVMLWAALGTYALGAPVVHAANGEYGRAVGSFGLRVGVPVATFYIVAVTTECEDDCMGAVIAGLAGASIATLLVVAVDDFGLSRKTRPVARSWTPTVDPSASGGMTFGVVGTF